MKKNYKRILQENQQLKDKVAKLEQRLKDLTRHTGNNRAIIDLDCTFCGKGTLTCTNLGFKQLVTCSVCDFRQILSPPNK